MIVITSDPLTEIEIGATGLIEIYQNVQTILSTTKGTVFLDRNFGVDSSIVDSPLPAAISKYRNQVISEIEKKEPRVIVVSIDFESTNSEASDGKVRTKVKIKIKDGVLL
ncbi:GPW/gp25 family protein [Serratia sp. MF2]|uniref:GPW/gp25 family protein n=1 Tax=Serratia sp. MF1(2023) TaxID=3059171 RepID=UPI0027F38B91|nr:GPW/gp25 family protein [Serratia sp. MF1(2023)]MDQ7104217.1 GPW/gp25 family protein [Serratia sp. MF1(2023)]